MPAKVSSWQTGRICGTELPLGVVTWPDEVGVLGGSASLEANAIPLSIDDVLSDHPFWLSVERFW
jgi:hypothetical protein